jgi:hypothetical protein
LAQRDGRNRLKFKKLKKWSNGMEIGIVQQTGSSALRTLSREWVGDESHPASSASRFISWMSATLDQGFAKGCECADRWNGVVLQHQTL